MTLSFPQRRTEDLSLENERLMRMRRICLLSTVTASKYSVCFSLFLLFPTSWGICLSLKGNPNWHDPSGLGTVLQQVAIQLENPCSPVPKARLRILSCWFVKLWSLSLSTDYLGIRQQLDSSWTQVFPLCNRSLAPSASFAYHAKEQTFRPSFRDDENLSHPKADQ